VDNYKEDFLLNVKWDTKRFNSLWKAKHY